MLMQPPPVNHNLSIVLDAASPNEASQWAYITPFICYVSSMSSICVEHDLERLLLAAV